MATAAGASAASRTGTRRLGERAARKLWEQQPITLFVQSSANCTASLELLAARTDTVVDMIKIIHVSTLTRASAPPFLRGVPTVYFRDADSPQQQVFEGDGAVALLTNLPHVPKARERYKGVGLRNFGIRQGRRGATTPSTARLCNMRSSKPVNNQRMQRRSAATRILQAQLRGQYAAASSRQQGTKARGKKMSMKERVKQLHAMRKLSDANMPKLQAQFRAQHSTRNFLDAGAAATPSPSPS